MGDETSYIICYQFIIWFAVKIYHLIEKLIILYQQAHTTVAAYENKWPLHLSTNSTILKNYDGQNC